MDGQRDKLAAAVNDTLRQLTESGDIFLSEEFEINVQREVYPCFSTEPNFLIGNSVL